MTNLNDYSASVWAMDGNGTFIQWEGTDLCMDFYCPECKHGNRYDNYFAHFIKCAKCESVFQLKASVEYRKVDPALAYITPLEPEGGLVIDEVRIHNNVAPEENE